MDNVSAFTLVTYISKVSTSTPVQTKARSFVAIIVLTELIATVLTNSTVHTSYTF